MTAKNLKGLWDRAELSQFIRHWRERRGAGMPFISYLTKVRRNRDPRTP